MPANNLPSGIGDLFRLGEAMKRGLRRHGPWIMRGAASAEELASLLKAARATETIFSTARARKAAVGKRFIAADEELTRWLAKARLVAMLALGSKWSEAWLATGFTHRGTNVPKRIAPRIELAGRLAQFFADNRKYEVPFAGVTAKTAGSLCAKIAAAEDELRMEDQAVQAQKRQRDAAEKSLRRKMSWVVRALRCLIKKNDPRWLDFGLKQPKPDAAPSQPVYSPATASLPAPMAVEFADEETATTTTQAAA